MLGCLSMGLLPHIRNEQTHHLCQLMRNLDVAPDYVMLVHQLVRGLGGLGSNITQYTRIYCSYTRI
jgi:hypothetical protein